MQYTLFGKEIRKMMIERNLRVYDLAKEFDVSSAFISSILTGKKNFPQEWFGKIKIIFNLDDETIKSLMNLNEMSKDSIKIDLSNSNDFARETAFAFQRNLNNLDYESLLKLNDILNKKDGKKMVNDYETKPLSRNELRLYASIIRKRLNINTIKIPVIELMDILERDYNVEFIIEEDDSFDDGVMAYTYEDKDSHFVIKVRNSVYESACRGNAKCIGFICQEMCHFFLISWFGCKPIYGKKLENKDIERYKSMEWQAKALCGELMIPFDIFKDKPLKEIIIETNSSLLQANYFLSVVCKYN